jgi:hypothetical protein
LNPSIKIVYAQSRRSGVDRLAFIGAWREHGGIAMQVRDYFGAVTRYVQADAAQTIFEGVEGPRDYDGVGEIVFPTLADVEEANASAGRTKIVAPHGHRLFGAARPVSLIVASHEEWRDRNGSAKLYTFVKRAPSLTRAEFAAQWAAAAPGWAADERWRTAARSYARDIALKPEAEFDGVEEVAFDTLGEARRALDDASWGVRSLEPAGFCAVLTQPAVLLDLSLFA